MTAPVKEIMPIRIITRQVIATATPVWPISATTNDMQPGSKIMVTVQKAASKSDIFSVPDKEKPLMTNAEIIKKTTLNNRIAKINTRPGFLAT